MTWHFLEVWALLLAAFAVGGVLGTLLYIGLAASPLANAQLDVADALHDGVAAVGDFFGRWRAPAATYGAHREPPAYVMPLPAPPLPAGDAEAYAADDGEMIPAGDETVDLPPDLVAGHVEWVEEVAEALGVAEDEARLAAEAEGASWTEDDGRWHEGETDFAEDHWQDAPEADVERAEAEAPAGTDVPDSPGPVTEPPPEPVLADVPAPHEIPALDDATPLLPAAPPEPEAVAGPETLEDAPAPIATAPGEEPAPPADEPRPEAVAAIAPPDVALPPPVAPPVPQPAPARARQPDLPSMRPLTLPGPRNGVPDNLQRIRGIGKKNEELLNRLGVYHFGQIAAWTPAEARWIASHMAFPERIERDDWIGQAIVFATGGDTGFVKVRRRGEDEESPVAA